MERSSNIVQVICTTLTGRTTKFSQMTVNPGSTAFFQSDCGSDKWLVGGGFITGENTPHNIVVGATPGDAANDFWKVNLSNPDTVVHTANHVKVCMPK